jgi:hypothetical protein
VSLHAATGVRGHAGHRRGGARLRPNNEPTNGVDAHALADQLRCQKRIGRGITSYVGIKLRGLIRGHDPLTLEASARRRLDRIPTAAR